MLQLLGPVGLHVDGRPQPLGSPKERCAFAVLALDSNRTMSAETLITRVWDDPPAQARSTLTSYITRLRRHLEDAVGDLIEIPRLDWGYRLDLDPELVDVRRFQRLRRAARTALGDGDDEHAIRLLRAAEDLGSGEALGGVDSEWISGVRTGLEEERQTAWLDRTEAELRQGRHADVLDELRRFAAVSPANERVCEQFMTALYASGRQTDALAAYQRTRAALRAFGVEPGPPLREIHRRVLRQELTVVSRHRRLSRTGGISTLPDDLPDFIGRAEELAALQEGVGGLRIKLLVGPAGAGKTTVAVRVGHHTAARYRDAQLYLDLAGHDDERQPLTSAEALGSLLRSLEIPPQRIPAGFDERVAFWRAESAGLNAMIVLDDPVGGDQVKPLLPVTGSSLVLIASRHDLDLPGPVERVSLGAMSVSDARDLFAREAGCANDDRVATAVELCRLLPLNIRLFAGRVASGEQIEQLIAELIPSALGSDAGSPEARVALDLSYDGLTVSQRRVLHRLSWYPGDRITVGVTAALADQSVEIAGSVLDALTERHMLQTGRNQEYRIHDSIRVYVRNRAAVNEPSGEMRRAIRRVLHYSIASAGRADRVLHPDRRGPATTVNATRGTAIASIGEAAAWRDSELHDAVLLVEYALEHEFMTEGVRLAYLIARSLNDRGMWEQESSILKRAHHAARVMGDGESAAWIALESSVLHFFAGESRASLQCANEALAWAHSRNRRLTAAAHDQVGMAQWALGLYRDALAHGEIAVNAYVDLDDHAGIAKALSNCGIACWHLGKYREARNHFNAALIKYRRLGDRLGEAKILNNLGDVLLAHGDYQAASDSYDESWKILDQMNVPRNMAILNSNKGGIHLYKQNLEAAADCYEKALAEHRDLGGRRDIADVLNSLGVVYRQMGRFEDAHARHEEALVLAAEIDSPHESIRALLGLGGVYRETASHVLALEKLEAARNRAREVGDRYYEAKSEMEMGVAENGAHEFDAARVHLRKAYGLFRPLKVPEAKMVKFMLHALDGGVLGA